MKDIFDLFNSDGSDGDQLNDDVGIHHDYHQDDTMGLDGLDISTHTGSDFDLSHQEIDQLNHHTENGFDGEHDSYEHHDNHGQHDHDDITFGSSCVTACSNTCIGGCIGTCLGGCSGSCSGTCSGSSSGS
ncbi:MAG: hypothetical protein K6U80_13260 [Firmicutes bacterium]|nr:hypothetical protein [Bacillota bacterium]